MDRDGQEREGVLERDRSATTMTLFCGSLTALADQALVPKDERRRPSHPSDKDGGDGKHLPTLVTCPVATDPFSMWGE